MRRYLLFFLFLATAATLLVFVYLAAFRAAAIQLESRGQVQLSQAADRLLGQLAPFRQLPNLLARHPVVTGLLSGSVPLPEANEFLANTALTVGADGIQVLDRTGRVIAASDFESGTTAIGADYGGAVYVRRALEGALGMQHGIDATTGQRDFFIARGVIDGSAPPIGVVVVLVDVDRLEFDWKIDPSVLVFVDRAGVIFLANRSELAMTRDGRSGAVMDLTRRYGTRTPGPFPDYVLTTGIRGTLSHFAPNPVIPSPALVLSQDMPWIDMTARIFLDTAPSAATARLVTLLAAAMLALIGATFWAVDQRRRRLTDRLAAEARANALLEARVNERTEQLRAAQDQLVQAGKLSALGQLSAGISHELSQPLATIRNYAENGLKFIDRDRTEDARGNLGLIAEQAERINRIIRNLRAFARNEPETLGPVDVSAAIEDALSLVRQRAQDEGVVLERAGTDGPVLALGGKVRLQQVLVNLLSNAMDAVAGCEEKRVTLTLHDGATVDIKVEDTGHGIAEPSRVFEPFYTTKEIGASKGLGLGLSISYGIIGSFGGTLDCANRDPGPGAIFRISLRRVA